MDANEKAIR